MSPEFITIAIPFAQSLAAQVDDYLDQESAKVMRGGVIRDELRDKNIHFMSIVVAPARLAAQGKGVSASELIAHLVIESVIDTDSHTDGQEQGLNSLVAHLGPVFDDLLKHAQIHVSSEELKSLLSKHMIVTDRKLLGHAGLNHNGLPGMSLDRIRKEESFVNKVRMHATQPNRSPSLLARLEEIKNEFNDDDMLAPAPTPLLAAEPDKKYNVKDLVGLVARGLLNFTWPLIILITAGVLFSASLVFGIPSAGVLLKLFLFVLALIVSAIVGILIYLATLAGGYRLLRAKEKSDQPATITLDPVKIASVTKTEDDGANNHLASCTYLKAGWLRLLTLKIAFWVIEAAAAKFKPGHLAEIGTIHFARWVLIPGTDKLIFLSNYSGSWGSYLEDFITRASKGLTGVWSNARGFPRTRNLFFSGAEDGDRFKLWARDSQLPSRFWYRAYPELTTQTIRLNAEIRKKLIAAKSESDAAEWFSLFGSRGRPHDALQWHEIQSLAFGGLGHLGDSCCCLIRLPDNQLAAQQWLKELSPQISFGERSSKKTALIFSATQSGLKKFGLPENQLHEFSTAFQTGMAEPRRASQILSDIGHDSPEKWQWGSEEKTVDIALLVFAEAEPEKKLLNSVIDPLMQSLRASGGDMISQIDAMPLPTTRKFVEPFGFRDGISQPIIRGTHRWQRNKSSRDTVAPGEFILGYPDNRGFVPPSPGVSAWLDTESRLSQDNVEENRISRARFSNAMGIDESRHDFGLNGSYLVIRQLEQLVDKFNYTINQMADQLATHPNTPENLTTEYQLETWIKAKLVGRWPDGTSLVRYPTAPGTGWDPENPKPVKPDNDFLLGSEDPEGLRCPFSSHIRRSNPRESFVPGSDEELAITNRHRVLRVGRTYSQQTSAFHQGQAQGVMFMCLNSDIERQFEFVQQTWVMSKSFHGLSDEVDGVLGNAQASGKMTVPTTGGPIMLEGIKDFVRVCGGGYFFMPSRSALQFLSELPVASAAEQQVGA